MDERYAAAFLTERPASQRFWVVRASGGHFVRHFRSAGVIAIGHVDILGVPEGPLQSYTAEDFELALARLEPDRPRGSVTSHARQAEAFCAAIQLDDLVITLDVQWLSVGRVTGAAFMDRQPVVMINSNGSEDEMPHGLRRTVSWGPLLKRDSVPLAMEMTLFAHQTVFNIDRYWTSVYHLLFPCFTFEGRLYLSANIRQQSELDNYSISQLFGLLSGVEVMAKLFTNDSSAWQTYPANLPELRTELDLSLTSKAEFMSPGTIWSSLLLDSSSLIAAAIIYVMLFGGDLKFFKADGLIDTHTRQKFWALVLKLLESHDFKKIQKDLKVDVPRIDTSAIEVPAQKEKRARRKSIVNLAMPSDRKELE